jgi:polar amino acid transport system substrate-binding protein
MRGLKSLTSLAAGSALVLSGLVASTSSATATTTIAQCQASFKSGHLPLVSAGKLTVASDINNGLYQPWFGANGNPSTGKGYESALAYAIAKDLGITSKNVKWTAEAFDSSFAPGSKNFDFDINEISVTTDRAQVVDFSNSYYNVQQSIVALKTNAIVKHHSATELKNYTYGDQIGTTGLDYINNHIKPTKQVHVYNTLDEAVAALTAGQVDAIVVDTPTGQYMAAAQIVDSKNKPLATQVGQFPSTGEHYGLLFQKGNTLVGCVNAAIADLTTKGTIKSLQSQYLGIYTKVPKLTPIQP